MDVTFHTTVVCVAAGIRKHVLNLSVIKIPEVRAPNHNNHCKHTPLLASARQPLVVAMP